MSFVLLLLMIILCGLWDLSSLTRDWTWGTALKAQNPDHWTTSELLSFAFPVSKHSHIFLFLCSKENSSYFAFGLGLLQPRCLRWFHRVLGLASHRRSDVLNGFFYPLHGYTSFWDASVFPRLKPLLCCFCILDFQVLPRGYPLQAARPRHAEGQPLLTTDGARALTTMTSLNRSLPHHHHQAATRKVSHFLGGPFWHLYSRSSSLGVSVGLQIEWGELLRWTCSVGRNFVSRGINKLGKILHFHSFQQE